MGKILAENKTFFISLILVLITLVAFQQVRHHQFIYFDDEEYVTKNPHVQTGLTIENIRWAFFSNRASNWHPLTWLSHMLDCRLFGLNSAWHHFINLLLHTINVVLLFIILRAMTGAAWRSAFVAAAFAVHPLRVESVAWIAERKDVLSTLFWMLTMAAYMRYVRRPAAGRYLLTLLIFALGLLAKPMLVTLPFVLLLLDYWPLNRFENIRQIRIMEKIPFFALSAVSSVITFLVQRSSAVTKSDVLPASMRMANAVISYVGYIGRTFWPGKLALLYPYHARTLAVWRVLVAVLILLMISIAIIYLTSKRKYLLTGWLWFLGTLVPVIGLVQVGAQAMADRYTYIPSIGLFIIIAWGINDLLAGWRYRQVALGISAPLVILVLSICTNLQLRYWHDSITLFEHTLAVTSDNSTIHNYLGTVLASQQKFDGAISHYRQALQINPTYAAAYFNLGWAYSQTGCYAEAADAYKQAVTIRPNYAEAYYNLGTVYERLGYSKEVIEAYKQAIAIKPDYAEAYYNLGCTYNVLGLYAGAIEAFRQTIRINPFLPEPYNNLGSVYTKCGNYQHAIDAYKQAIKIKPEYAPAYYNLGVAYISIGNKSAAVAQYEILKKLDSNLAHALFEIMNK